LAILLPVDVQRATLKVEPPVRQFRTGDHTMYLVQIWAGQLKETLRTILMSEDVVAFDGTQAELELSFRLVGGSADWDPTDLTDPWTALLRDVFIESQAGPGGHAIPVSDGITAAARFKVWPLPNPEDEHVNSLDESHAELRGTLYHVTRKVKRRLNGTSAVQVDYDGWLDRAGRPLRVHVNGSDTKETQNWGSLIIFIPTPAYFNLDLVALPSLGWLTR
jgi:hypothetical protein